MTGPVQRESAPLVSVVISTYRSEAFIRQRLENLVGQTLFDRTEVIVVDSASPENEGLIVKEYCAQFPNIHYLRTPERETIYKAWNRGIRMARGRYITNANADDRLRKDALALQADALDAHPDVAMVYGDQYITPVPNSAFESPGNRKRFHRPPFDRLWLLARYGLGSHPMWRASLHSQDGIWFDEKYEVAGDYEFACRVAELYPLLRIPETLGVYYRPADGSNKEFVDSDRTVQESCEIQEKYARRYLASISERDFNRLYRRMRRWTRVPRWAFTIAHRSIAAFHEERQILNRIFWCWIGSLMEEHKGDVRRAASLCLKCMHLPAASIVRNQYRHLTEGKA